MPGTAGASSGERFRNAVMAMRLIDAAELRARLPWPALIEALRQAFVQGCEVPQRHVHRIGEAGTSLLMPAWQTEATSGGQRCFGVKVVNIFPGNGTQGLPGLHGLYNLFDAATGVPLAVLDGSELTARRTAAASALAADYLARPDVQTLLILGAGRIAALLPAAFQTVRPGLQRVLIWNHRAASALDLAARLRDQGLDAAATSDLSAAVRQSDLISCATLSTAALVAGDDLQPGCHLDLIGSFTPQMREADARCFARARVFVDTSEALSKSGDLLSAMAEGGFRAESLQGDLTALCRGSVPGRLQPDEITLFKGVGTALEDLAAATLACAPG